MIHLARPDLVSRGRDRRAAAPVAQRPGFWQRLARLATRPLRELLRRSSAPAPAMPSARRRDRVTPRRPAAASNPTHEKAVRAVREMQANSECLLPNWLSNVEVREVNLSDAVRQRLFGTGPSA